MANAVGPPEGSNSVALQSMRSGGALQPIYPQSLDDVYRYAKMATLAGTLKPLSKKVKNGNNWEDQVEDAETTIARGSMIIMQGMEIGMPPNQALQLIAMINGRCCVHSEGVPALLWSKGFSIEEWWVDGDGKKHETAATLGDPDLWGDGTAAVCKLTRPGGKTIVRSFSVGMAKTARLWDRRAEVQRYNNSGKIANDAPWFRFADRMLRARALGFAAKDGAADAMRGMMTSEEAIDTLALQQEREGPIVIKPTKPLEIPFDLNLDVVEEAVEVGPEMEFEGLKLIVDDEQVISRATEARILFETSELLAKAGTIEEVETVERRIAQSAPLLSEEGRDSLIDGIETARKRILE